MEFPGPAVDVTAPGRQCGRRRWRAAPGRAHVLHSTTALASAPARSRSGRRERSARNASIWMDMKSIGVRQGRRHHAATRYAARDRRPRTHRDGGNAHPERRVARAIDPLSVQQPPGYRGAGTGRDRAGHHLRGTGNIAYQAGRSAVEVSLKRYRYTRMERDEESGLNYHQARYYELARQVDQLRSDRPAGRLEPVPVRQSSPTGLTDPHGTDTQPASTEEEAEKIKHARKLEHFYVGHAQVQQPGRAADHADPKKIDERPDRHIDEARQLLESERPGA